VVVISADWSGDEMENLKEDEDRVDCSEDGEDFYTDDDDHDDNADVLSLDEGTKGKDLLERELIT